MTITSEFLPVGPGVLIDSMLKIRMSMGRWDPESAASGGAIEIDLEYDPEIRTDRLTMPIPPEQLQALAILGPVTEREKAFRSASTLRLGSLNFEIESTVDELVLKAIDYPNSYQNLAHIIRRELNAETEAASSEILAHIVAAVPSFDAWDYNFARPWGKPVISLNYPAGLLAVIPEIGQFPVRGEDGMIQVSRREVKK